MAARFGQLPPELLDQIVSLLDRQSLLRLASTARWCNRLALPLIWREVDLVDREATEPRGSPPLPDDPHDDTPVIKKLLVLASNKEIAQCVQILNHRCHRAPPTLFFESWSLTRPSYCLERATFMGQTLSYDPRLIRLVRLAVDNLKNVHTLRIVHGHARLTEALVRSLFDSRRDKLASVRRLWLENCQVSEILQAELQGQKHGLADVLDFSGLESVRIRRLGLRPPHYDHHLHDRRVPRDICSLLDEWAVASVTGDLQGWETVDIVCRSLLDESALRTNIAKWFEVPNLLDDQIFEDISKRVKLPLEVEQAGIESHEQRAIWAYALECPYEHLSVPRRTYSAELRGIFLEQRATPAVCLLNLLNRCHLTLTSLTLDWLLLQWVEDESGQRPQHCYTGELERKRFFYSIFRLRFPCLRAFQVRNFITDDTELPEGVYLLDRCDWSPPDGDLGMMTWQAEPDVSWVALDFLEAHPKLQCLAWPMTRFFNVDVDEPQPPSLRVSKIIDNLAAHLVDLRVDNKIGDVAESHTIAEETHSSPRRFFIQHFASRMTSAEHIKISGSLPLDERREILRALHRCPLQRISVIGTNSSMGNTWGVNAAAREDEVGPGEMMEQLEEEDKDAIWRLGFSPPTKPDDFVPTYGWQGAAPMITTIAAYFGKTLQVLKLIGSIGAPVLLKPTPITSPMLAGLRYLDNLEVLIMSLWVSTFYEDDYRDGEVIEFWQSSQNPTSTALMVVDQEPGERSSWQRRLDELEPSSLARSVAALFGPHLSEKAKRKGVLIRASIYIKSTLYDMDVDVRIAKDGQGNDECCGFVGPRDELDPGRRKEKLDTRRWF